jgi:hypothetical protein
MSESAGWSPSAECASSACYQADPVVSCGEEEDGAILYNPDADDTTVLNPSGLALWAYLESPRTVEEMAAYLAATYCDVAIERATEDAVRFVEELGPDFVIHVYANG